MKIAGIIIQDRNVFQNDSEKFFAKYKGHEIHSSLFRIHDKGNNEYSYTIVKIVKRKNGGDNNLVCYGISKRCDIRDVVILALKESGLA